MKFYISLAMVFVLYACDAQQTNTPGNTTSQSADEAIYTNVNNEEAKQLMSTRPNLQIIDVRTDGEIAQGMIDGATQIDISKPTFEAQLAKLDKNAPILVYCAAGGRSVSAQNQMKAMGFKEVHNLSRGYQGWR